MLILLLLLLTCLVDSSAAAAAPSYPFPWLDPSLPIDQRVSSFIANLTVDEKVSLLQNSNPAIPRIGLPAYDWWSEASHGVAWIGRATAFPSPIALAATWNSALLYQAGRVVSDEGRGRHNDYMQHHNNDSDTFYGVNFFAPNINMFMTRTVGPRTGDVRGGSGTDRSIGSRVRAGYTGQCEW